MLGFLIALFVVLAIAPAVWRRAVALTEKRIYSTMPISREEIQAQTGAVRAEGAMAVRRAEMERDLAARKTVKLEAEASRRNSEIKELKADLEEKAADIEQLEKLVAEAHDQIDELTSENARLAENLVRSRNDVSEKLAELSQLSQDLSIAAVNVSNHEVELASREAELSRQSESIRVLREQLRESENKRREAKSAAKNMAADKKSNRVKIRDLENRLEKLMTQSAQLEERLERRDSEVKQLRSDLREKNKEVSAYQRQLKSGERQIAKLENEVDRLEAKVKTTTAGFSSEEKNSTIEKLEVLTARLRRENKALKEKETAQSNDGLPAAKDKNGAKSGDEILRDQINEIAAQVVAMTSMIQGEESPIDDIISGSGKSDTPPIAPGGEVIDLAERIRALQEK